MELLIELFQIILELSDFLSQIRLTQLDKCLYNNLIIYNFYNIDDNYLKLLSDNILKNHKYIKKLNIFQNRNVTNEGIKDMKLYTLDASGNPNITDKGIKHMKLHTLCANNNPNITDEGIKHMNLYTLDASGNPNITDEGIKHMNLHTLDASD